MDTILWFARLALSILAITIGWQVFLAILGKGNGAVADLINAMGRLFTAFCERIANKLKEKKPEEQEEPIKEVKVTMTEEEYKAWCLAHNVDS